VKCRIVVTLILEIAVLQRINELELAGCNEWKATAGLLSYAWRIYLPQDYLLCKKVLSHSHNNPESGHIGDLTTAKSVSRDFVWLAMDSTVRKYIAGC
jgi:hypothetical protein